MTEMEKKVLRDQILAVRDTGLVNMFDRFGVQRVAFDRNLFELVCFLEEPENLKRYATFIVKGVLE